MSKLTPNLTSHFTKLFLGLTLAISTTPAVYAGHLNVLCNGHGPIASLMATTTCFPIAPLTTTTVIIAGTSHDVADAIQANLLLDQAAAGSGSALEAIARMSGQSVEFVASELLRVDAEVGFSALSAQEQALALDRVFLK